MKKTIGDVNPTMGAPYVQGAFSSNPKEAMFRIRYENPESTREDRIQLFKDAAHANSELAEASFEYAAINADAAWEKLQYKKQAAAARAKAAAATQSAVTAIGEAIKRSILDWVMPNEKLLRDCTGAEVRTFNNGFGNIANAVQPDEIVGEVLSVEEAAELMSA